MSSVHKHTQAKAQKCVPLEVSESSHKCNVAWLALPSWKWEVGRAVQAATRLLACNHMHATAVIHPVGSHRVIGNLVRDLCCS